MLPTSLSDAEAAFGVVPRQLDDVTAAGVLWQANAAQFLLDVPGTGRYFVERGERLTVEEVAGCPRSSLERVARATPLAALAWQRGMLALHAAVAVNDGGAVLLAGDSCAGKSSLLAALLARGWHMLSDDVAVISAGEDRRPDVLPVSADVAVWPDVLERLGPQLCTVSSAPHAGRALLSFERSFASDPVPLRSIYWLGTSHRPEVEMTHLPGLERFRAVATLAYNSRIASATCDRARFLGNAEAVASSAPVRQVRRPRGRWTVDELADAIESASGP